MNLGLSNYITICNAQLTCDVCNNKFEFLIFCGNTQILGNDMMLTHCLYFYRNLMFGRCIKKGAGNFSQLGIVSGNNMKTS